jgi:hypothetical protein
MRPDASLADRIAREARHQDALTLGQFNADEFAGRKHWIWAEHDRRHKHEQKQEVPVLPPTGGRRRLWRRPQPDR